MPILNYYILKLSMNLLFGSKNVFLTNEHFALYIFPSFH